MKKMPDVILAVDIEATCWEKPKDQPPGQKNEIIEIGFCPISLRSLEIGEPKSILIKPMMSKVSPFCTKVTTLTQELVDTGISFREACSKLVNEVKTQELFWVSWGDYDRKHLSWQCEETKTPYPFGGGYWNFKDTFAKMICSKNVSIQDALRLLGLEMIGTPHRGADEAFNIARIIQESFRRIRGSSGQAAITEAVGDNDGKESETEAEEETED